MKFKRICIEKFVFVSLFGLVTLILFSCPVHAEQEGDFTYKIVEGKAIVTGYTGTDQEITIPNILGNAPVVEVGDCAFALNENITGVILQEGIETIEMYAFGQCYNLTNISLPESLKIIGNDAFCYSNISSVVLPEGLNTIKDSAFAFCLNLENINLPESLETIGNSAFVNCEKIKGIILPQNLKFIDRGAFAYSGLTGVLRIPESVEYIAKGAFDNCYNLTGINVDKENLKYSSEDGILYDKNKTTLIQCPGGIDLNGAESFEIPYGVTRIESQAFFGVHQIIKTVLIPESVTSIGDSAFEDFKFLENVEIPGGVIDLGEESFRDCNQLTTLELNEGVKTIGSAAFLGCESINKVILPKSMETIGIGAFMFCGLETIQFNSPATEINVQTGIEADVTDTIPKTTTIIGYNLSTAKDYAEEHGNPFKLIDNNNNEESDENSVGNIKYATHVQNYGWQDFVSDGTVSGTEGEGLRLEGIRIDSCIDGIGVSYSTHVENIGWQDDVSDGKLSGTSGKGLRLEAIKIRLTGSAAGQYDVYYQVHAQNNGWMGWAKNGESAGTAGYGYRLEGIKIEIVPAGSDAPGSTENAFVELSAVENALNKMVGTWEHHGDDWSQKYIITKIAWNKGHVAYSQWTSMKGDGMNYDFYLYSINSDGTTKMYIDKNSILNGGIIPKYSTISVDTLMEQPNKLKLFNTYFDRK